MKGNTKRRLLIAVEIIMNSIILEISPVNSGQFNPSDLINFFILPCVKIDIFTVIYLF